MLSLRRCAASAVSCKAAKVRAPMPVAAPKLSTGAYDNFSARHEELGESREFRQGVFDLRKQSEHAKQQGKFKSYGDRPSRGYRSCLTAKHVLHELSGR
jgi:hypothetical protein